MAELTVLLAAARQGDQDAAGEAFSLLYADLRRLARRRHGAELPEYPSTSGMTTYWEDNEGRLRVVVTLADWVDDDPVALVGILAHECYHVVCRISEAMADKKPSEEFVAYALSEVTSQMFADYSVVRSPLARAQRAEAGANGS